MKKIVILAIAFATFSISASAQKGRDAVREHRIERNFKTGHLTRGEKFKLNRSEARYRHERHKAFRDGRITPMEKRKLYKMKQHHHKQMFRYKHNARKRVL